MIQGPVFVDLARVDAVVAAAAARALAAAEDREFTTFRCGSSIPSDMARAPRGEQEAFREAVRLALVRVLSEAWPARSLDPGPAEFVLEAVPDKLDALIQIAPVFVAGRYRKLARGLSQTVFLCRLCHGGLRKRVLRRGVCPECGKSGRFVAESVEDFVRPAIERAAGGTSSSFHGAGREDVDVRMLGRGRPFVVSVEEPRRRAPDLGDVAEEIAVASAGRVEVEELLVVPRADLGRITSGHGEKTYRAVVAATGDAEFPADAAGRLAPLVGAELSQRTPRRVDERRADLVRLRRVLAVEVESAEPRRLTLVLRTDPGTYVKELISGDEGRTAPSVAALVGVACVCEELDVLDVG
jgi:tRNA pseudouridine synthase 10